MGQFPKSPTRRDDPFVDDDVGIALVRHPLAALEETRKTVQRGLEALRGYQERIEELERDRDALIERYATMVPEALDALDSDERHHVYKLLKLAARVHAGGTVELSGALEENLEVCRTESAPRTAPRARARRGTGP